MVWIIEDFRLDPELFELTRRGERVPLEPQAFDVLVHLVTHRDRVVSKEELMDSIWGGRFVTESAVTSRIKQARRAVGDDGEAQRLIRTVHGRGYRFVGPLVEEAAAAPTPAPAAAAHEIRAPAPGLHKLTGSLSHLIGRRAELQAVAAALATHRLVSVVGIGGIGKTRLVVEAARSRSDADGLWLVELAALTDGSLLTETVAAALGLPSPPDAAGLATLLRERQVLLVLDNCEQVTDDVAVFATTVLERCPDVRVLLTSRQRRGAPGEYVVELAPLDPDAAERLFLERAAVAAPGWVPDAAEQEAVTRLCAGLDRLPLALELAATQCRALTVEQLTEQLDDRFALLGGRHGTQRHSSMAAAVAWSYDSLPADQRDLFGALCLLEGSFDLDDVRAVSPDRAVLPALLALIDTSMVTVLPGSPRRYRILETLRQYAAQRRPPEQTDDARRLIVAWVLSLVETAEAGFFGADSRAWMERLDHEKETIRAALAWTASDDATRLRIAVAMVWFWYRRGLIVEALRALEPLAANPAHDLPPDVLPAAVALRGAVGVVLLRYLAGDHASLPAELGHLGSLVDTTDDDAARDYALSTLAYFAAGAGQIEVALERSEAALAIGRRLSADATISFWFLARATAHLRAGRFAQAQRDAEQGTRHADACGYSWGAVATTWIGCKARIAAGDLGDETLAGLRRITADSARERDQTTWLVGLVAQAYVLLQRGEAAPAAELLGIAARQGGRIGYAPEAMDPAETRQYVDELRLAVAQRQLSAAYDRGWECDAARAVERAAELVG